MYLKLFGWKIATCTSNRSGELTNHILGKRWGRLKLQLWMKLKVIVIVKVMDKHEQIQDELMLKFGVLF